MREVSKLRAAQTKRVMPLIGNLLDAWDFVANDTKDLLREDCPALVDALDEIMAAMEGEDA